MTNRRMGTGLLLFLGFALIAQAQEKQKPPSAIPPGTTEHRNLAYVADGHERQKLDLFLPPKADWPLPVVVWVHGGGWAKGDKENSPAMMFLDKGYAVASINYRLSHHAVFPAQIEDCKAAIRWLRGNAKKYNLNPDRIGVWGGSAGGHLASLLGTTAAVKDLEGTGGNLDQSSRVQAVINWFGPTDLMQMPESTRARANSLIGKLLGGPAEEKKELAARANPIRYVTKDAPPFLIIHGDQDKLVPLQQSELLVEALKKAGVEVKLVVVKGGGHGTRPHFDTPENRKLMVEFFDKHLKK